MKVCNPPAIPENEDISFLLEARRFGSLEHLPFVEDLEGVHPVRVLQLDDADLAERAAPDHLQDLEVVLAQPKGLNPISHRFNCKKKDMEMSLDSPRCLSMMMSIRIGTCQWLLEMASFYLY